MKKLFGTDGIRGVVNKILTPEIAFKCGRAIGITKPDSKVVVAKDTRISGDMLMCALVSGLVSQGVDVDILDLSSTPALASITKDSYDFGVMITASHNPYFYNGIKIFDKTGNKLSDTEEGSIEEIISNIDKYSYVSCDDIGDINYKEDLLYKYVSFIKSKLNKDFYNLKICIDTANGGAVEIAKKVFAKEKFLKVSFINSSTDGRKINQNCGATNLEMLKNYVISKDFDIGFAFDGDADRIMGVDNKGNIFDGDDILFLLLNSKINLEKNTIVGTVMTNMGLEEYLKQKGINLKRVAVGDKYIKQCMVTEGFSLGGESSGHIITNENCTGDAVYVTTQILNILEESKKSASQLLEKFYKYPSKLLNIEVEESIKNRLMQSSFFWDIIKKYENVLNCEGRIYARASGTEPLIRILIEGKNLKDVEFVTNGLDCDIKKFKKLV